MKRILIGVFAVVFAFLATGCSSVSTEPDEVALHYSGGSFSSKNFESCVDSSNREFNGPGDAHYVYPANQRTFSFTGAEGSERGPINVTTVDGQEVSVPGFVTFSLNTDCETLREFHEKIGFKYKAYKDGGGWTPFVNDYIYTPLDAAMNEASLAAAPEGWYSLYSDAEIQNAFEVAVVEALPDEVAAAIGGDFITIHAVQISKPNISEELRDGLQASETARLENQAQTERNEVARTKYESMTDCLNAGLSESACVTIFLAENGDIPFYTVPQGGSLNVNPPSGG